MERAITPKSFAMDLELVDFFYSTEPRQVVVDYRRGYRDDFGFHLLERETVVIAGADYDALLAANEAGKVEGQFRTDDVLAIADMLKAQ